MKSLDFGVLLECGRRKKKQRGKNTEVEHDAAMGTSGSFFAGIDGRNDPEMGEGKTTGEVGWSTLEAGRCIWRGPEKASTGPKNYNWREGSFGLNILLLTRFKKETQNQGTK